MDLRDEVVALPPHTQNLTTSDGHPFYMVHYSYGAEFFMNGTRTGEFSFNQVLFSAASMPAGQPCDTT